MRYCLVACTLLTACGSDGTGTNDNTNQQNNNQPASCGDGIVQGVEECDDGVLNSDSAPEACRTDCRAAHCGDGVADPGNAEECDDGLLNSDTAPDACRLACTLPACGDGIVDQGFGEECDDGDGDLSDSCPDGPSGSCLAARCGDGYVWSTDGGAEACDDGNEALNDSCPDGAAGTCEVARCGDGFVWDTDGGSEGCDDGDNNVFDACPDGVPGACQPARCGDGFRWDEDGGAEGCDDGNDTTIDSCPDGANGTCQDAVCGDGHIWSTDGGSELCDDANAVDLDGCIPCDTITEFLIVDPTVSQFVPGLGIAQDGSFAVTWAENNQIFVQRFDLLGTPDGTPFAANSAPAFGSSRPNLSMTPAGEFVATWADGGVSVRRFDATAQPLGPAFVVDPAGTAPRVAIAPDGRFVLVWQNVDVVAQRYDSSGASVGGQLTVNDPFPIISQPRPAVAMAPDGRFAVAWRTNSDIRGRLYDANGVSVAGPFPVETFAGNNFDVQIAMRDDGSFIIVWNGDGQDTDFGIHGQRFDALGTPAGPELVLNGDTAGYQGYGGLAMAADGSFVVKWRSDFDNTIRARQFDSTGLPVGADLIVGTTSIVNQHRPHIAVAPDGRFVVAFLLQAVFGQDGIYAQRFRATGEAIGILPW